MLPGIASSLGNQFCPVQGEAIFCCAGAFTWIPPPNVRSVSIVMVAAGGNGRSIGGQGGSLQYINKVIVNPCASCTICVGNGNFGCLCGGCTSFAGYYACGGVSYGGFSGTCWTTTPGNAPAGQGYIGGCGGPCSSFAGGGGGGAGGYAGPGGRGGAGGAGGYGANNGTCTGGGGGGGSGGCCTAGNYCSWGGGGVNVYGCTTSGAGGLGAGGSGHGGGGGSGGFTGGTGFGATNTGCFGGGGGTCGSFNSAAYGSRGAMRIIWSNIKTRSFPATNTGVLPSFSNPPAIAQGQVQYTSAGAYSWVVPANVYSISAVTVGAGGGSGTFNGGGGGALVYANCIPVSPGMTVTICVGASGACYAMGGCSFICSPSCTGYWIMAGGGQSRPFCSSCPLAYTVGGGGGAGGYPDPSPWPPAFYTCCRPPGSGGATQYGTGGCGGGYCGCCTTGTYYSGGMIGGGGGWGSTGLASCGSGIYGGCNGAYGGAGGGAGGHVNSINCCQNSAYGGGGVGLCGRICNGTGGPARGGGCNVPTQCGGSYPAGGSCGSNYGFISSTSPASTQAGSVGGGAGGACNFGCAGNGGVRIVWSNSVPRVFPTCNVGCLPTY